MLVNGVLHPCDVIDVPVDVSEGVFIINRLVRVWPVDVRADVVIDSLTDVVTKTGSMTLEFVVASL